MRIAGVYSLGFFIELAEYFIFFIFFKLLCMYRNEEQNFLCVYKDGKQYRLYPRASNSNPDTPVIIISSQTGSPATSCGYYA